MAAFQPGVALQNDGPVVSKFWPASLRVDRTLTERLRAKLTRYMGCADDAADIMQDSYVRFALRGVEDVANPDAYIGRVVTNIAIDYRRRRLRYPADLLDESLPSPDPSAERILIGQQDLAAVLKAAERLPSRCREIFILRKIEGWEQQEIARHFGISLNMVQKHLRKAMRDISAAVVERDA